MLCKEASRGMVSSPGLSQRQFLVSDALVIERVRSNAQRGEHPEYYEVLVCCLGHPTRFRGLCFGYVSTMGLGLLLAPTNHPMDWSYPRMNRTTAGPVSGSHGSLSILS